MARGGSRVGAGRPKGTTKADGMSTKVVRVSTEVTKEMCDNIPQLLFVLNYWEDRVVGEPDNPRYYYLKQLLDEVRGLGY